MRHLLPNVWGHLFKIYVNTFSKWRYWRITDFQTFQTPRRNYANIIWKKEDVSKGGKKFRCSSKLNINELHFHLCKGSQVRRLAFFFLLHSFLWFYLNLLYFCCSTNKVFNRDFTALLQHAIIVRIL